jgi:hypothetical protein
VILRSFLIAASLRIAGWRSPMAFRGPAIPAAANPTSG